MKEEEILDRLLEKLQQNENISNQLLEPIKFKQKHPSKAKYYFKNYQNNIYNISDEMKNKIDKNHARAIHNSAVMIYNLLGDSVIYDNKEYEVEYEKELKVIKDNTGKEHIAHLDFFMKNDSKLIFGEAKMLEWLRAPKYLKDVYLLKESYIDEADIKFIDIFDKFIKKDNLKRHKVRSGYKSIYNRYDAFQMLIHILGIYRFVRRGENRNIKDIELVNVVWGNEIIPKYNEEKKEATEFIEEANTIFNPNSNSNPNPIFKELGVEFKIKYYNYEEFKQKITFKDNNRKLYLERYNINFS